MDIGVLHNEAEANANSDDTIVSNKVIDFIPNGVFEKNTGIGEVNFKLKVLTQSTANISFSDKLQAPEVLLVNSEEIRVSRIVPTLSFTGGCADNIENNNDIFVKGNTILPANDVQYEEGTVFEIKLLDSVIESIGSDDVYRFKVEMPYNIGFKIEALVEDDEGSDQIDESWEDVTGSFKLEIDNRDMIEIIPVSSSGKTVVEKKLRISGSK